MIDITTTNGIVFLVVAFLTLLGILYSIAQFIRWQIRYLKEEDFDLPPFAVVGAVVVGLLIMAGAAYVVFVLLAAHFSQGANEALNQLRQSINETNDRINQINNGLHS